MKWKILMILLSVCGCAYTYGQTLIRTVPPGAQLEVEGQKIGRTPMLFEYSQYSSNFKLTKEGYRSIQGDFIAEPKNYPNLKGIGFIGGLIAGGLLTIACVERPVTKEEEDKKDGCFLIPIAGGIVGLIASSLAGREHGLHDEYIFDLEPLEELSGPKPSKNPEHLPGIEKKDTSVKELPLNEKEMQGLEKVKR